MDTGWNKEVHPNWYKDVSRCDKCYSIAKGAKVAQRAQRNQKLLQMRKLVISIATILLLNYHLCGQQQTVHLILDGFQSSHYKNLRPSADSAICVANELLNSQEFRDSILKYDFSCLNYGSYCKDTCKNCDEERITGRTVLDNLYKKAETRLILVLNKCSSEYGHSSKDIDVITSCYKKVRNDELSLPFSFCYAYHIAHEYMHIVGFFHTDYIDDIAEATGWIGYYILKRWYEEKKSVDYSSIKNFQK